MGDERDEYGVPVGPAERMQQVMLALFDLMDDADLADFPRELLNELDLLRLRFLDEFERLHLTWLSLCNRQPCSVRRSAFSDRMETQRGRA